MGESQQKQKIVAAILAGGLSSRMGTPKAGVRLSSGLTVFETVWRILDGLNLPRIIVGHAQGIESTSLGKPIIIPDAVERRGPVGALLGLLQSGLGTHYLVVGCDQILLTPDLLQTLVSEVAGRPIVLGRPDGRVSPLPALIPETAIRHVEELLCHEQASLRKLLEIADDRTISISEKEFERLRSVNTPQDLAELDRSLNQ